ncbi:PREDICTED: uncharacterized protein LOC104733728 [Camelina sativa]|uniref:Uncharacterized protein LOC104733728 n=1 Tax=Camelina sativa TaxID=90675 RepID=A0ABM0V6F3_CAMSA|nr:PREDICTED: uncharacterized protein LOC104733728 [Camelina sativa]
MMVDTVSMEVNDRPCKILKLDNGSKASSKQLKVGNVEDDEYLRQYGMFHYEYNKSEGFTIDWEKYDYVFPTRSLDTSPPISQRRSNAEIIREYTIFAIEKYNQAHLTKKLVFDKHVSANFRFSGGLLCFLTFWATDRASSNPESQIYQARVWRLQKRYDIPIFRLKPKQEEMDSIDVQPPVPMYSDDEDKPPVVFLRAPPEAGVPFVFDRTGAFYFCSLDTWSAL